jgi:hypothetical protein
VPEPRLKWRMPSTWTIVQSDRPSIAIKLEQDGNTIVGTACRYLPESEAGTVHGSIDGDQVSFTVYWPDKAIGEYLGTVNQLGIVTGTEVSSSDGALTGTWQGEPALAPWE